MEDFGTDVRTDVNNIRNKPRAGPKGNSSQTNTFHPRIVVDNLLASEYLITSL